MFRSFHFLMKFIWKYSKAYFVYIFLYQIFSAAMPLLSTVMSKYIIDELIGLRRVDVLLTLVGILIGYNCIGGCFVAFLRLRYFTAKGKVFVKFRTYLAEQLSRCDLEQLENPEYLDIKEKAGRFL